MLAQATWTPLLALPDRGRPSDSAISAVEALNLAVLLKPGRLWNTPPKVISYGRSVVNAALTWWVSENDWSSRQ